MSSNRLYQQALDMSSSSSSLASTGPDLFNWDLMSEGQDFSFQSDDINMSFTTPHNARQHPLPNPPPLYQHSRQSTSSASSAPSPIPFNTSMAITQLGIIQTATHAQLTQASNAAYANVLKERDHFRSQLSALEKAYQSLLARVQAGGGLIVTQEDWPILRQEDYPNIKYWSKADWSPKKKKPSVEASIKNGQNTKPKRGKNADLASERESMSFIEYEDGTTVVEADARLIGQYLRKILHELQKHGEAPAQWGEMSVTGSKSHWKIEELATSLYSGWYRPKRAIKPKDENVEKEVKVEDKPTVEAKRKQPPTSATSSKPTKQTKTASASTSPSGDQRGQLQAGAGAKSVAGSPELGSVVVSSTTSTENPAQKSIGSDTQNPPLPPPHAKLDLKQQPSTEAPEAAALSPSLAKPPVVEVSGTSESVPQPPVVKSPAPAPKPPVLNLANPLAAFAKSKPVVASTSTEQVVREETGTSSTEPSTQDIAPPALVLPVAAPTSTRGSGGDGKPFKYNKSSCATWNIFGAEWAPKQPTLPTKQAVLDAYNALSDEEKLGWEATRKTKLAARNGGSAA